MNPLINLRQLPQFDFQPARAKLRFAELAEQLVNPRSDRQHPLAHWLTFGILERVLKCVQKSQFVTSEQAYSCAIGHRTFENLAVQKSQVGPACRAGPATESDADQPKSLPADGTYDGPTANQSSRHIKRLPTGSLSPNGRSGCTDDINQIHFAGRRIDSRRACYHQRRDCYWRSLRTADFLPRGEKGQSS
jgi:hypothetical protein